jgi:hypothetical protein
LVSYLEESCRSAEPFCQSVCRPRAIKIEGND